MAHELASMSWRDSNIKKTPLKVLWMRKPIPIQGGRRVTNHEKARPKKIA
jgi:hypothetical protein